nr:uncharacterized protein LOC102150023 [Equus caballus]XP_023478521.1 uncharacterized protein LOC102150023 [Equus caballus]XP_023478522.1 uncharacterized protein LOC102150023 [Equus caballus]
MAPLVSSFTKVPLYTGLPAPSPVLISQKALSPGPFLSLCVFSLLLTVSVFHLLAFLSVLPSLLMAHVGWGAASSLLPPAPSFFLPPPPYPSCEEEEAQISCVRGHDIFEELDDFFSIPHPLFPFSFLLPIETAVLLASGKTGRCMRAVSRKKISGFLAFVLQKPFWTFRGRESLGHGQKMWEGGNRWGVRARFPAQAESLGCGGGTGGAGGQERQGGPWALLGELSPWAGAGLQVGRGDVRAEGIRPHFPGRHQVGGGEELKRAWRFLFFSCSFKKFGAPVKRWGHRESPRNPHVPSEGA